jgi:spectinomycin phosphotransferase
LLEKPDIQDETIIACIQVEYGIKIAQIAFLPLGGDLSSAVYRASAQDGTAYFSKLRFGEFDGLSVELPKYLSEQGIEQIITPLVTQTGRLWADVGAFCLILSPFVEGQSGFETELSEQHWAAFGKALKQIHTTPFPAWLEAKIDKELFSAEWCEECRQMLERVEDEAFDDPYILRMVTCLESKREIILDLLGHSERLAQLLRSRNNELVLCHSDIHPGNLFLDTYGPLYIVDWDYPTLALKERDLMFVGGGQGFVGISAEEEERYFYRYYDAADIDLAAMAYYRCERNIKDVCVETARILTTSLGDQDREQSMQYLSWLFLPDFSVDQAYRSLEKI